MKELPLLSRKSLLTTAPEDLIISIKRFHYDFNTQVTHRIEGSLKGMEEVLELPKEYFVDGKGATYRLRSIICHTGERPSSGHYTTFVRKTKASTRKDHFCLANDSQVVWYSGEEKETKMAELSDKAYLLYYEKI